MISSIGSQCNLLKSLTEFSWVSASKISLAHRFCSRKTLWRLPSVYIGLGRRSQLKYLRPKLKSDKNTALFQHSKEIRYFFSVLKTTARSSILRHLILPLRGNQQEKQTISLYQPNSNSFGNYPCCLTLLVSKCVWKLWVSVIDFLYSIEIIFNISLNVKERN